MRVRTARGHLIAVWICFLALPARALRIVPGSFTTDVTDVFLTRSITVSAALEDDKGTGAEGMEISLLPDPPQAVRPAGGAPPVPLTCTPAGGRTQGSWVFEAAAPGRVRFRLTASMMSCYTGVGSSVEELTPWVTLKPLPLWSDLAITPRALAPGSIVTLTLTVRNDAPEEAACSPPGASEDFHGRNAPLVAAVGRPVVEPAGAMRAGRIVLPPGKPVSVSWRFKALASGDARFQIIGAGLVIMSPPVMIRPAAALGLSMNPQPATGLGREVTVRGRLRLTSDTPARDPWAGLAWSPAGAARLVRGGLSSTEPLTPEHDTVETAFTLETLAPGPLALTLSAGGRETDSGNPVNAVPVSGSLYVQAPSVLSIRLTTPSATVLVGGRAALTVRVTNGTRFATQGMSPIIAIRRGHAALLPFSPLFQTVPAGGSAVFTGAIVPDEEGELELVAQATTRDDRGGPWATAAGSPVRLLAVAAPRLEVFSLNEHVPGGVTSTIRFLVHNASPLAFAVRGATMTLAGAPGGSVGQTRLKPVPLSLAAGATATMSVSAFLPDDKKPYGLTGLLYLSGTITAYRLPCAVQSGSRPVALVAKRARGIVWTEPEGIFRPPLDPVLGLEWSLTVPGVAGLAVTTPEGALIRTLVAPALQTAGYHAALWAGDTDAGGPVAPGTYQLRLAGPAAGSATPWPAGARWHESAPVEVKRP